MPGKRPGRLRGAEAESPPRSSTDEAQAPSREVLAAILARSLSGQRHCEQGVRNAQAEGDSELVAFFEHAASNYVDLAERAGSLLAERLGGGLERRRAEPQQAQGAGQERKPTKHPNDADEVDEASWQSFPASDPPPY